MKRLYAVRRSRAAGWAKLSGGLAVPVLVLAVIGMRAGLVPVPALLPVLVLGFLLALLALGTAVTALIDVWNNGAEGAGSAVAGIVYAAPALVLLGLVAAAAVAYPRLTDVTTNPLDPPQFIAAPGADRFPERADLAVLRDSYPDLVTRDYALPLGEVYAAVRHLIEDRGWTIVRDSRPAVMPQTMPEAATPQAGESDEVIRALARKSVMTQSRGVAAQVAPDAGVADEPALQGTSNLAVIEATALTPVFAFRDDVVVRMRGSPEGTEVDMRSASQIGAHDLGQNARRIRSFFARLDAMIQPEPGVASIGQ